MQVSRLILAGILFFAFIATLEGCAYAPAPLYGVIYSDLSYGPHQVEPGPDGKNYTVLGVVQGSAKASSILGIIATGDASTATAFAQALVQIPQTDALIDVTVDYHVRNVLLLYAEHSTVVTGVAVRYNSDDSDSLAHGILGSRDNLAGLMAFRKSVLGVLNRDHFLRRRLDHWCKERRIARRSEEFVKLFDQRTLEEYQQTGASVESWLKGIIDGTYSLPQQAAPSEQGQ